MPTYGSYDKGQPCLNSSCKSHGRPHPNCKCYGGMASGGSVTRFCDSNRNHEPGCEYFADGGPVGTLGGVDPSHAVAGHIANTGLTGILRMGRDQDIGKYEKSVARGHKTLDDTVGKVINGESLGRPDDREKYQKFIDNWVTKGGIDQELQDEAYKSSSPLALSSGGKVEPAPVAGLQSHPIETVYPDHNVLLNMTKGRVSNYLNSLRPQPNAPRLPFDDVPDDTEQKKEYETAVKFADNPLSILHEAAKGTVVPEHLKHLNAMYPELNDAIQKKITEKIIHSQISGQKPKTQIRQSLSLLTGTALSSELTPALIQAAQAVFSMSQPKQDASAPPPRQRKSQASLTKSDQSFLTGPQALVSRQQKAT